jgi:hypothetical protein
VNRGQFRTRGQLCEVSCESELLNCGQSGTKWWTVHEQVLDQVENLFHGVRFLIYDQWIVWQLSVDSPATPSFVLFGPFLACLISILSSVFCVGLLPFHRLYLGALVTGWLGYPRFGTLLLLYRSGVSCFLVYWFGALSSVRLLCGDPLCFEGTSTLL